MNAQVVSFLFLFILNCLAMLFFYLMLKSRFSRQKMLGELRSEVDKLIVDLGREADRDVALLESRIKNLRSLIDEADRRTILSERETAKRQDASLLIAAVQTSANSRVEPVMARSVAEQTIPVQPIYVNTLPLEPEIPAAQKPVEVQSIQTPVEPVRTIEPVMVYTRPAFRRSEKQIEPEIPINERVLEMSRKGISPEMISSTLSVSLGEVELIIAMNRSSL